MDGSIGPLKIIVINDLMNIAPLGILKQLLFDIIMCDFSLHFDDYVLKIFLTKTYDVPPRIILGGSLCIFDILVLIFNVNEWGLNHVKRCYSGSVA
jgi:hypothetical protein